MNRRNLSRIYFFDQFPEDEKPKPTCFEDCTKEKQEIIVKDFSREQLERLTLLLADTIKQIGDQLDLWSEDTEFLKEEQ